MVEKSFLVGMQKIYLVLEPYTSLVYRFLKRPLMLVITQSGCESKKTYCKPLVSRSLYR